MTTGHGADSCLGHLRPHVQHQSWNLIYWGTGCEDVNMNTALLYSDIQKICSDFVTVCSSFYAEMSPVTFNHLKNFQNISLTLSPQTTCRKWPVIHPPWSPVWTPPAQSPVSMYPQCHHYHHLWCTHKHTHLWRCEVFYTLGKRVNIAVCGNIVVSLPLET